MIFLLLLPAAFPLSQPFLSVVLQQAFPKNASAKNQSRYLQYCSAALLPQNRVPVIAPPDADATTLGAPAADRDEVNEFIDSIPDVPRMTVDRVKEDAGIAKKNLLKRMIEDAKEFGEEAE